MSPSGKHRLEALPGHNLAKVNPVTLKTIYLTWNPKTFQAALKLASAHATSGVAALNLSGHGWPETQEYSYRALSPIDVGEFDSPAFLADYRDLMGSLSSAYDTRWWWATNIASKNRFTSRIPVLLQQVEACTLALNQVSDDLVIYDADLSLLPVLEELAVQSERKLSYPVLYPFWVLVVNRLRTMLGHGRSLLEAIRHMVLARIFGKPVPSNPLKTSLTVLKTFFYQSSIDEKDGFCYHDPMFGRLPEFLAGREDLIILTQILDNYRICIKKINRHSELSIIPVERWLSVGEIVQCFFTLLFLRLDTKVPARLMFRGINVSGLFRLELYRKNNDIPFNQMLYYPLMKRMARTHSIKHYIHTYENNPWEKMAIAALREVSPATVITGYQQSVVPQASVNVFNSGIEVNTMPLPDRILCVGQEPVDILNKYSAEGYLRVEASCGLRYEYLQEIAKKSRKKIERILVAPEGVEQILPMLCYVVRELKDLPQYQITFRFHPSLSYKVLKEQNLFDLSGIENAALSKASLQEDLMRHDVCIYWGSTVALEALSLGMPLIHFDVGSWLSFDPLFRCLHLKWIVTDRTPLPDVFNLVDALSDEEYDFQARKAKEYLKKYFFPVSEQNLKKFVLG